MATLTHLWLLNLHITMKKSLLFTACAIAILLSLFIFTDKEAAPTTMLITEKPAPSSTEVSAPSDASAGAVVNAPEVVSQQAPVAHRAVSDVQSDLETTKQAQVLRASQGGTLGLQMPALPRGKAKLQMEDREVAPQNLNGHYQRVLITGESKARVELQWPGVGANRPVFVHAIHGGKINGKSGDTFYTTGDGELAFNFTSSPEAGRSEVLLRSGPSEEVLHFWTPVGAPEIDRFGL